MTKLIESLEQIIENKPAEWEVCKIGDLLKEVKEPVEVLDDKLYKLVSIRRANGGIVERERLYGDKILTKKLNRLVQGTFVIAKMQVSHGACSLSDDRLGECYISDSYISYKEKNEKLHLPFFNYYCHLGAMRATFLKCSHGVHIEKMTFKPKEWLREKVIIPPKEEQIAIANRLDEISNLITTTNDCISKNEILKQSLLKEFIHRGIGHSNFQESHFGMIPKSWTICTMNELFTHSKEKGSENIEVGSVTMRGLVPRSQEERKVDSELKPEDHLLVKKGEIAYNMMRMWQGVQGYADKDYIVSPAYVVLSPKNEVCSKFYSHLFETKDFISLFHKYSYGLTGDRLRLYFDEFSQIPAFLPPMEEQKEALEIFESIDNKITNLKNKVSGLQNLKRGIIQDLVTGHIRVT